MKKINLRYLYAYSITILSSLIFLTSCQNREENSASNIVAKTPTASQLIQFEISLKSLNSVSIINLNKNTVVNSEQVVKNTLLEPAKELIRATGCSDLDIKNKFGNNETEIISTALKIHADCSKGNLN